MNINVDSDTLMKCRQYCVDMKSSKGLGFGILANIPLCTILYRSLIALQTYSGLLRYISELKDLIRPIFPSFEMLADPTYSSVTCPGFSVITTYTPQSLLSHRFEKI